MCECPNLKDHERRKVASRGSQQRTKDPKAVLVIERGSTIVGWDLKS